MSFFCWLYDGVMVHNFSHVKQNIISKKDYHSIMYPIPLIVLISADASLDFNF